ncbi:hypothetical protein DSBG_4114 [Desulfosporosinus sp. BG]|nr:hypothetical protein DSBG_4114 [Desulfosporosinus sp. BG]
MSSVALVAGLICPVEGAFSVLKRTLEEMFFFEYGANFQRSV